MIAFELEHEHEQTRQRIFESWDDELREKRDSMPLEQMLAAFEASFWFEERAFLKNRKAHARRKVKV